MIRNRPGSRWEFGGKEIRIPLKRDEDRPGRRREYGRKVIRNRAGKLRGIGQERDKEKNRKMMRNMTRRRQE